MNVRFLTSWLRAAPVVLALGAAGCATPPPKPPDPIEVVVSPPVERGVVDHLDFTGRTEAKGAVKLQSKIGGYLAKVNFTDGAEVKAGQVLFQIDDRTYRAERDLAQADVNLVEAQVKEAEAEYRRNLKLRRTATVSQEELEKSQRALETAQASLDGAKASLKKAQINLDDTQVKTDISGRADRASVSVGNLISADTSKATLLTTIVDLEPMHVYFGVDEPTVLRLRLRVREGTLQAPQDKPLAILLGVGQGQDYPFRGTIDFVSNSIDPATGTLKVRGSFPNKDRFLRPGMFARLRVPIGEPYRALLVSETCVGTNQGQKFVYVVDDNNEVVYRPVKLGPLSDGLRIVEEGLKGGERIIVGDGMLRVRPGTAVIPVEGKMAPVPVAGEGQSASEATAPAVKK